MNLFQLSSLLLLQRQLGRRQRWDRSQLESFQAGQLQALRQHAYARSPFYRRFHAGLTAAPLQELPVLTKSVLMKNWDELVTDRSARLAEVEAFLTNLKKGQSPALYQNRYYAVSTSGSTGLRGIFIYGPREWMTVLSSYVRASRLAGIGIGLTRRPRVALVSTTTPLHQSALVSATLDGWFTRSLRIDSTEALPDIVSKLNLYQPRQLFAYAGLARLLAQEQIRGSLKISPEVVFSVSEVLTRDSRLLINQAWGVQPFNLYASTETAAIASECLRHQVLHLYEDLLIVEVVDHNNKPVLPGAYGAKMLATVLFSRTLPLIRYEISDSLRLSTAACSCHCPLSSIADIQGRAEDLVRLKAAAGGGIEVQPNLFHDVMETFRLGGWQLLQEGPNSLKISILNPGADFREADLSKAVSNELSKLGALLPEIKIELVSSLSRGALGKTYLIKAWQG